MSEPLSTRSEKRESSAPSSSVSRSRLYGSRASACMRVVLPEKRFPMMPMWKFCFISAALRRGSVSG